MSSSVFEIARRYVVEVLEEGSVDVLRRLVAPNVVRRGPMGEVSGIASLEDQLRDEGFSDVCIVIDDIIATEDEAVIRYAWYAQHNGELFNIAPTYRRIEMHVVEIIRLDAVGRIADADVYFDVYALFEQLGMLPHPHQLAPPQVTRPMLRLVR